MGRICRFHPHCHAVADAGGEQGGSNSSYAGVKLLEGCGYQVEMLPPGCCGMAGPFGFEKDKFAVSQAVGERVLLPAVRNTPSDGLILSDGFSCREQILQATGRRAVHLAEAIQFALHHQNKSNWCA